MLIRSGVVMRGFRRRTVKILLRACLEFFHASRAAKEIFLPVINANMFDGIGIDFHPANRIE
jgi:hypothetical protein